MRNPTCNPKLSKICKTIHDYLSENRAEEITEVLTETMAHYIIGTQDDESLKDYVLDKTMNLSIFMSVLENQFKELGQIDKEVYHA